MLTVEQIRMLLDRLAEKIVHEPTDEFPFRVSRRTSGYSDDDLVAHTQVALSIMLQAKSQGRPEGDVVGERAEVIEALGQLAGEDAS